jgi:hypothetical protein
LATEINVTRHTQLRDVTDRVARQLHLHMAGNGEEHTIMQLKNFAIMVGTLALGLAMSIPGRAQPTNDVIKVNLPYAVTVDNKTLQPGDYMIKELPSTDDNRVLVFYRDNGLKFEVLAQTISAYDAQTLSKSELTLHHIGNNYYFDKVWVQGKNYGYQIPLPSNVKEREKELTAVSVPATSQAPPAQQTPVTTADNTPAIADNTPAPAPQEAAEATVTQASQATPEPAPVAAEPAPAPAQPEIAQNTALATPDVSGDANREELPHTSAGWLLMMLSGGSLSGVGLMLRRRS